jgi:hypothetical protein
LTAASLGIAGNRTTGHRKSIGEPGLSLGLVWIAWVRWVVRVSHTGHGSWVCSKSRSGLLWLCRRRLSTTTGRSAGNRSTLFHRPPQRHHRSIGSVWISLNLSVSLTLSVQARYHRYHQQCLQICNWAGICFEPARECSEPAGTGRKITEPVTKGLAHRTNQNLY